MRTAASSEPAQHRRAHRSTSAKVDEKGKASVPRGSYMDLTPGVDRHSGACIRLAIRTIVPDASLSVSRAYAGDVVHSFLKVKSWARLSFSCASPANPTSTSQTRRHDWAVKVRLCVVRWRCSADPHLSSLCLSLRTWNGFFPMHGLRLRSMRCEGQNPYSWTMGDCEVSFVLSYPAGSHLMDPVLLALAEVSIGSMSPGSLAPSY